MEIKIFKFIFFNEKKKKKTNKQTHIWTTLPPTPKKKEKNKTNTHKVLYDDLFAIPNAFPHQWLTLALWDF